MSKTLLHCHPLVPIGIRSSSTDRTCRDRGTRIAEPRLPRKRNVMKQALRNGALATAAFFSACFAVLVAHHPVADAQSAGGAVSPTVPADTAELADRRLRLDISTAPSVLRIVLPAVDAASQRSEAEARDRRPLQIGFPRAIPSDYRGDLSPLIDWTSFDDGSIGGAVLVTSPGARALRVAIRAELGSGGEIRFFEGNAAEENTEQAPASQDFRW